MEKGGDNVGWARPLWAGLLTHAIMENTTKKQGYKANLHKKEYLVLIVLFGAKGHAGSITGLVQKGDSFVL